MSDPGVTLFSTSPPFHTDTPGYLERVVETATWSERAGCRGTLVYTDNGLLDVWLVSAAIVAATERLRPLVAVQPVYMHPYSVAKAITSLVQLGGRGVDINLVAGGFKGDLEALDDTTPHDLRYDRLVEYGRIIQQLLDGGAPVTFEGRFHTVRSLRLSPPMPADELPMVTVSGSSEAGIAASRALDAVPVRYPSPDDGGLRASEAHGVRVGIIAREDPAEAWAIAHARFPPDRRGQLVHQLAMATSDSRWHHRLARSTDAAAESPYWMVPFQNYKTFCPYLVGGYEQVAELMARHLREGCTTVILDVPFEEEDFEHTRRVMDLAAERRDLSGSTAQEGRS